MSDERAKQRQALKWFAILATATVVLGGLSFWQCWQFRRDERAYQLALPNHEIAAAQLRSDFLRWRKASEPPARSRSEFEAAFPQLVQVGDSYRWPQSVALDVRYVDRNTNCEVLARFWPTGELTSVLNVQTPVRSSDPLWRFGRETRQAIARITPWVWVALFLWRPFARSKLAAVRISLAMALAVLLFAAGGLPTPNNPTLVRRSPVPWLILMGFVTTVATWRAYRRPVVEEGLCRQCGYDLRATPDRCPECGTVPVR